MEKEKNDCEDFRNEGSEYEENEDIKNTDSFANSIYRAMEENLEEDESLKSTSANDDKNYAQYKILVKVFSEKKNEPKIIKKFQKTSPHELPNNSDISMIIDQQIIFISLNSIEIHYCEDERLPKDISNIISNVRTNHDRECVISNPPPPPNLPYHNYSNHSTNEETFDNVYNWYSQLSYWLLLKNLILLIYYEQF